MPYIVLSTPFPEQRVLDLVNALGKSTVGYQEIFDNGLAIPTTTVVDVWKNPFSAGQAELAKVTAAGYPALMASGWYINYEAYVNGGQWETYYNQVWRVEIVACSL